MAWHQGAVGTAPRLANALESTFAGHGAHMSEFDRRAFTAIAHVALRRCGTRDGAMVLDESVARHDADESEAGGKFELDTPFSVSCSSTRW